MDVDPGNTETEAVAPMPIDAPPLEYDNLLATFLRLHDEEQEPALTPAYIKKMASKWKNFHPEKIVPTYRKQSDGWPYKLASQEELAVSDPLNFFDKRVTGGTNW